MCTEEIPRQERAAESYMKQSVQLDTKIAATWAQWNELNKKMNILYKEAVAECSDLSDFVEKMQILSENRHLKARDELRLKLLNIENEEITAFTEYMSDMPSMLKKLYLILKGYDKAPPALTAEYLEIMKKAKSARGITWSDKETECDSHFKFISSLDLDKPTTMMDFTHDKKEDVNVTIDIVTDSDDTENREPTLSAKKRKGTPIKLVNNETIIINDSLESLDITRNLNSAKKLKTETDPALDIENYVAIDPKDLNSTFVLAEKMANWKKLPVKSEKTEVQPVKRGLMDRTNTMAQRTINFGDNKAKVVKPVVGRAVPIRRAGAAFGSSVARDGAPLARNVQDGQKKAAVTERSVGFKAVRAREKVKAHPYSRPVALHARK